MTDADLISLLGTHELARQMGVKAYQVAHWKTRGIPFKRRIDVLNIAHEHISDAEGFLRGEGRS